MGTENENRAPEELGTAEVGADTEEIIAAEEKNENKPENKNKNGKSDGDRITGGYLARLVITLSLVCAVVAALLATVNAVTKDKIAEHNLESQKQAVYAVFPDATDCEPYDAGDGRDVYVVTKDGEIAGYAVKVTPTGFGGEIEMMVGIDADGKTAGVSVITMSETPGVGTKTNSEQFLSQFRGKDGDVAVGDSIDAVTGATISSKAITEGVRQAHEVEIDLGKIAAEKGSPLSPADGTDPRETEPAGTEPPKNPDETKEPRKETDDTKDPQETKGSSGLREPEFSEKGADGYNAYPVYVGETDDAYQVEIDKEDYESLLEKEDDPEETTGPDEKKEP